MRSECCRVFLLLPLLVVFALGEVEIAEEDGVLVLNQENFQSALDAHNLILVEFYAPWCGHCKKLAPEYAAAAKTLAESGSAAKLAKVDATENKDLGSQYGVKGYPTLKFFKNGEATEYTGGRTAETIVAWVGKKSGPLTTTLSNMEEVDAFLAPVKVAVIGFFKNMESAEAQAFAKAAEAVDDQVFGIVSAAELFQKFEIKDDAGVILLKKFDEGRNTLEGDITEESITGFVLANSMPLVVDFNQDTAKMIFSATVNGHLFMFLSAQADDFEYKMHNARKLAKDLRGDIMFVSVTTDEEDHKKVLDFFGVDLSETPTYRLAKVGEDIAKYVPESSDFSDSAMATFITKFKAGELTPHLKSENLPEDWDKQPVKVLVGSNFEAVALDSTKDVLVEFYAPWCGHCKKLAPIWDELGEHFKDDESIVIAKLDATANELLDVKVRGFPTIKLFSKGDNKVVDYAGGRTLQDFINFLTPQAAEEKTTEEKKDEL